jgi:hypothetical protein
MSVTARWELCRLPDVDRMPGRILAPTNLFPTPDRASGTPGSEERRGFILRLRDRIDRDRIEIHSRRAGRIC